MTICFQHIHLNVCVVDHACVEELLIRVLILFFSVLSATICGHVGGEERGEGAGSQYVGAIVRANLGTLLKCS